MILLAKAHGAALIALTIDEVGMAKTADRKLEIAKRITEIARDEHGLDREALIFDALTFTLTTGDQEWRPSAVETIAGIRAIKEGLPGVKTSLGVSNVSFGVSPPARAVLNSVFLNHCVEAGSTSRWSTRNHITPYGEYPRRGARARRRPRVQPPRRRARAVHRALRGEGRGRLGRGRGPRTWSPPRRSTGTSCAARRTGWRTGSTVPWTRSGPPSRR